MMKGMPKCGRAVLALVLAGVAAYGAPAAATTHAPPPVYHASSNNHHYVGPGWHGYHHGYGFYGYWPWYFPLAYGYGLPYYGTTFYADAPVVYVQMAPADQSEAVQPSNSWYYCRNPEGYFPYVRECPSGWQTVPVQPVPPTPPAPPAPPSGQ